SISTPRAAAAAWRKYSCESRIERLPPVAIEPHTRLRRTCSAVEMNSVRTFVQSHSSSSATSMGSPVELPCPISERATRMRTLLSGLTTIHAVSSGPFVFAAAWERTGVGTHSSSARPPPTAVDTLRKSRRDLRNGIVMIGPIDSALRPILLQYALCSGQFVIPEVLPQLGLEELPRRGVRQLLDEDDVVGHPPLRHFALVEPEQVLARDARAGLPDRDDERPLVPFRVAHADHRGFRDRRMRHGDVLQIDRADPFSARLDHVLRAIGDLHKAVRVDGGDVARGKPSVAQGTAARALEVFVEYPGPAHGEIAEGLAVARQVPAFAIDDFHFDAIDRAPLLELHLALFFAGQRFMLAFERAEAAERAHLRHPPGVLALDAVIVAESIDHRRRAGRPSDCDGFQRAESEIVLLHMGKQCEPHGGYAG